MAGYTEEETEKLNDLLEEMTPQERDKAVMEAARLLRAEQEWRDAGCLSGKPYRVRKQGTLPGTGKGKSGKGH